MAALGKLTARLAAGAGGRTEADLQADVRSLLLAAPLHLDDQDLEVFLEAPAGGGRRIDIEAGCMVIEVKKSLASASALAAAVKQLGGYVRYRSEEGSQRYVGVLTDGRVWILYHLRPNGELAEVSRFLLQEPDDLNALSAWLETVLATAERVTPSPKEIVRRLGSKSPAAQLDLADLHALYAACRSDPEVQVKRELWARLLLSALGTSFEDSDELFVTHTYLVLTAELIAHEIMGLPTDLAAGDARALLEGQQFAMAGLHGVVEADFFDWPATISQGQPLIAAIARRLSRFDWNDVEHDVLKALYESVIDADTRRRLGEYYTPDWLAEKIVCERFDDPLNQRLLDPACGSGTFLFWAVRQLLAACDRAGIPNREALRRTVSQVQGMDLHPVAVTLARVTYLLALSPERLRDRDELTVPIFLGDSLRWEQDDTVLTDDGMRVQTSNPMELIEDQLHFPEGVVERPQRFDRLVADLASRAASRRPGSKPGIKGLLDRHDVADGDREAVIVAFRKLCRLHDDGRDHVWSYYIRNLARPLSFTRPDGQVDALVGNPPWLAYRSMPSQLQSTYKGLAEERGLWAGGKVASHQDLSDLFVARSVEQYLKPSGSFSFVMPYATLSRRQYAGFRTGDWGGSGSGACVALQQADGFAKVKPPLFPMPSCVITGKKADAPSPLPNGATEWRGRVPSHQLDWKSAAEFLRSSADGVATATDGRASPYGARFRQGAVLVPRMLLTVEEVTGGGRIGVSAGRRRVRSARSNNEKSPWKGLPSLEGVVEERFLRRVHLGATMVAFRAREAQLAVVPYLDGALLDSSDERLDEYPGLAEWWRNAEEVWNKYRSPSTRLSLREQIDYQTKLSNQFPVSEHRVAYTASGQHLAACRIEADDALIEKALYWGTVDSVQEGQYVCAILNSDRFAEAIRPLQARGQHNPRHFDMHVFAVAFPLFDPSVELHQELVALAGRAEAVAESMEFDLTRQFQRARRAIREALREEGIAAELDRAVNALLLKRPETSRLKSAPADISPLDALPSPPRRSKRSTKKRQTQKALHTETRDQKSKR